VLARWTLALCLPILLGCGATFTAWGHEAAVGAIDALTSPDAGAALATVGAEAAKAAASAARDEALGQATDADVQRILAGAGATAREQADDLVTLDLRPRLLQTVRLVIDEALDEVTLREISALREQIAGQPLQQDLNALIDAAAPHLTKAVQQSIAGALVPIQVDVNQAKAAADAEAAKWKPIAIGLAVGAALLIACLALAVRIIGHHARTIAAMARSVAPPRG